MLMLTDEKYDFRGEKLTLLITYLSNISVAAIKGVFGFLSLSLALIADAIHSLFDSVSNIVGLWAFKMTEKPVDTDHHIKDVTIHIEPIKDSKTKDK